MAGKEHRYRPVIAWTGNTGEGTASYKAYERSHVISAPGKPDIPGSSDANFRGDASRWNPEDLFVVSASTCHMLWYLHLCAVNDVVVLDYRDEPEGRNDRGGRRQRRLRAHRAQAAGEAVGRIQRGEGARAAP